MALEIYEKTVGKNHEKYKKAYELYKKLKWLF
jgi:hypothetical protein